MAVIKQEWKTYDTLHAIDLFRSYWQENERLISKEADRLEIVNTPKWTPTTEDEHGEFRSEQQMARYFHEHQMLPIFRYSCLVMLNVIIERELVRLVKNLEKENGMQKLQYKDIRGDCVKQVQRFAEAFFGLRFAECDNYEALHDLKKIRNCIVHCHGQLSLLNKEDAAYLIGLGKRRRGFFAAEETIIFIWDECCIEQFIKEIREFFESMFKQLNWSVG